MNDSRYILTLSCNDVCGIVAAVTGFLADNQGFIIESAQFGDASTATFFMRVEFTVDSGQITVDGKRNSSTVHRLPSTTLRERFAKEIAEPFAMQWQMISKQSKSRVLILVSKYGHCLNDLLYRHKTGQLAIDIPAIASNHPDWQSTAEWHGIPFYHLPSHSGASGDDKSKQEAQILEIMTHHHIDVVVLARYMQILSAELCNELAGRAINIHHSFLPSFKGAKPYQQAFDRGVKLIGATAHYVTTDLDEGPIIEQEVARVDHTHTPADLTSIGRDIECQVLARALKYHTEHRVLLNGGKTVVFR